LAAAVVSKQATTEEDAMQRNWIVAGLAALLLALTACQAGDDESGANAGDGGGVAGGETAGVGTVEEGAALVSQSGGAQSGSTLPALGPRVIQTASLSLTVPEKEFLSAVDRARNIAIGLGGFVVGSSSSQGREQRLVSGTLELRVPSRSYGRALERLSALGRLESSEESGQDVSREFVDLEARSRHLQAVERQLLELLERADTVPAALSVQSQLNQVQLELEQVRGRLRYLEDQVAYATISVAVRERQATAEKEEESAWGIVDAWGTAAHGFVAVVGWIFVVAATIAPVVVLLLLAILGGRFALRRTIPVWRRS
jgi:Domain of unknown function (DUF4349)